MDDITEDVNRLDGTFKHEQGNTKADAEIGRAHV